MKVITTTKPGEKHFQHLKWLRKQKQCAGAIPALTIENHAQDRIVMVSEQDFFNLLAAAGCTVEPFS